MKSACRFLWTCAILILIEWWLTRPPQLTRRQREQMRHSSARLLLAAGGLRTMACPLVGSCPDPCEYEGRCSTVARS